ncbi:alpha,alpha-trehalase TreA [Sphingomonas gilva]|uniref:Alpha,alpha-trehalase TreA n=1 Tax=Sphingomonas gilva TaxID=2305907 RepID=A0A396RML4_9SPHN|nr:alpha,alpha-trehalase TreA [Sphingomonas gilva]RHW16906.1 alpha,alpha-trehalase TreA [Sphingomonas gilva]
MTDSRSLGKASRPVFGGCALVRRITATAALIGLSIGSSVAGQQATPAPPPPSVVLAPFFEEVALSDLFPDGKLWADAEPRRASAEILRDYSGNRPANDAALRAFVAANFKLAPPVTQQAQPTFGLPLRAHIRELWPLLTRSTPTTPSWSSLLPLPNPYVVPGGRFTEIYYWDSYFTMLGFGPEQAKLQRGMVDNFAHLITTYGHVPNGNRSYYLSRSQPPFFFKMVELTNPEHPAKAFAAYLRALKAEYRYWMNGADRLKPGQAAARVVRMANGALLNRYWDDRDAPRDEAYRVDVTAATASGRTASLVYRNLRAGAESGWDYSSRWFADGKSLGSVRTSDIVPPDLNSLMFGLEGAIADGCAELHDQACVTIFRGKARARASAMRRHLWNGTTGLYDDYLWTGQRLLGNVSAASLYPLFFRVASQAEADSTARVVERELLKPGGLVTTNITTGQQWDAPNGWAPLQWIAVGGLRNYGETQLAETIARRWLTTVAKVYADTGKLLEKYDVVTLRPGGGGEYPLQDGFGWTNGTTIGLMKLYPGVPGSISKPAITASGDSAARSTPWP